MRVLVVHQNFPGQFGHLVQAWAARPGWQVRALGRDTAPGLPGFDALTRYRPGRDVRADQHPYLRKAEAATLHGQAAARTMLAMKRSGFVPDAILAHPGWGETLFAKDVFPDARLVHLCEWYYSARGADVDFDPEFPATLDDHARLRSWNALHALNLVQCDAAVSPTHWQRERHPAPLRDKVVVQHEGIDTERLAPDASARLTLPGGMVLRAGDPVVTFVARNLEPYRGFHVFMRALARIQKADPRAHAVVVGGDGTSYGRAPKDAPNWRERMLREVAVDPARTHFTGRLPHARYLQVLQVSAVHVYLTYPFVLSWSMLEAMACGALVVGSDTPPVREVLRHRENGLLVPFFDQAAIADTVCAALESTAAHAGLRERARADAASYSRRAGLAGYDALLCGASPAVSRPPIASAAYEEGLNNSVRSCPSRR